MPDSCLYITFTKSEDVYYPGSVIEGIAHLILKDPIKARALKIKLDVRAHTSWDVSRSETVRESDGSSSTRHYTESYSATTVYANEEIVAWRSPPDEKEVMPAGSYQFPFAFTLPLNSPPSFEGSYGYVRYVVMMELDRPWRFNKRDKKAFTVVPVFDLNTISEAVVPVKDLKVKKLGIILFRHGEVTMEYETPKKGFVPGEMIVINASIINDSSKDIIKAKAKLVEVSNYVAYSIGSNVPQSPFITKTFGDNHRQQRRKLATGEQDLCIKKKDKGNIQLYLQVPSTVPSFNCCPIVSVEYVVEMKLESTGSLNSNIETSFPVIIGTIPLRQGTSRELTSLSSTSHSSTPGMENLPPYSLENDLNDPQLPPSYVESVKGVNGTVVEKESIEPFVPRYPFYTQPPREHEKPEGDVV